MESYFYHFLKPVSEELTRILEELERAIYQSPRFMITHSRTLIEAIMEKVMIHEHLENIPYLTILERTQRLNAEGLLTADVHEALHEVRKLGNIAAHDTREFRFSESLLTWERIYIIVKWFVEVYGSHQIEVPAYEDPKMKTDSYDLDELRIRMERFEDLLRKSIDLETSEQAQEIRPSLSDEVKGKKNIHKEKMSAEEFAMVAIDQAPGLTPVRTLSFKSQTLDIPHFLRDAFLLPQRFPESVRYIRRLNEQQEARIMSELPVNLNSLHKKITRYNESHTEVFFHELKLFIEEEIRRKRLIEKRPGELFLFYKGQEIIVTENFGKIEITPEQFPGSPNLIRQLHEDGIKQIRHLPKEFVIIGKYQGVGEGRVSSFYTQLNQIQEKMIALEV